MSCFVFDCERGPRFLDRQPDCAAQEPVGAEDDFKIAQRLRAIVPGDRLDLGREMDNRAKVARARHVVAYAPARHIARLAGYKIRRRIKRIDVIAGWRVGDIQALPGEPLVQEAGAACVAA
jgi:hypothetical protein